MKYITIPIIILLITAISSAVPEEPNIPQFPPGHSLYKLKLVYEKLQETFTFNKIKLIRLKQEHMQNRIDELRYEITYKNSNHAEELIEKIKVKENEIEEITNRYPKCIDGMTGRGGGCQMQYQNRKEILDFSGDDFKITIKNSQEVLTNLLNDPRMPNSSKKGLENALKHKRFKENEQK